MNLASHGSWERWFHLIDSTQLSREFSPPNSFGRDPRGRAECEDAKKDLSYGRAPKEAPTDFFCVKPALGLSPNPHDVRPDPLDHDPRDARDLRQRSGTGRHRKNDHIPRANPFGGHAVELFIQTPAHLASTFGHVKFYEKIDLFRPILSSDNYRKTIVNHW